MPLFNNEPGIYSEYAGEGASDKQNLDKLIDRLKQMEKKRPMLFIQRVSR